MGLELKKQTPYQVPPRRPFPKSGKRILALNEGVTNFLSVSGVAVAWAGLIIYLVSLQTK